MKLKDKIYNTAPHFFQNLIITLFNFQAYKKRYGGKYKMFLTHYQKRRTASADELKMIQRQKYKTFIKEVMKTSVFYKNLFSTYKDPELIENLRHLPILGKELLRKEIKDIYTIKKKDGIVSKTGGTTGKSLEVVFTADNMQERFAMLDDFRSRFGYKLGKKTAWFSGKSLLTSRDLQKNRFWKTDYLYKVRYYSTFHIKENYLKYYLKNLIEFKPEYMVGFPSSILAIAKYGLKVGLEFPEGVRAVFPTAETVTEDTRKCIETFFKTQVFDQYASSEGAPFIFECKNHNLHLELQSGVFEVLNEKNEPDRGGKLVVTSFTTEGTPLIRYDIGDSIELSDNICDCGNNNPLVKRILGRIDDYIYSPENGKINLGNVSNTLKDTKGIIKFQTIQDDINAVVIRVKIDNELYNSKVEEIFVKNWRDRLGDNMKIDLEYVDDISTEASGKFRLVKNNVKHLIE